MNCLEVTRRQQRLEALFKRIKAMKYDPELEAHWTRYLCVLSAGFIEESLREIFGQYATGRAPATSAFVMRQLRQFQNPKMQKIYELAGSFNNDWRKELEIVTEGKLRDSVDSIVHNRHQIAHGRDVQLTYPALSSYFADAVRVLSIIDEQCNN